MYTEKNLNDDLLICVAEHFINFNKKNPEALNEFIKLLGQPRSPNEYLDDLPQRVGVHMNKYIDCNTAEVLEFIYPMVERLKSKIKTLYLSDKFDFFVYQFFYDNNVNQDIIDHIRKYLLLYKTCEKVEFNIYFSQLETWLMDMWEVVDIDNFYEKVANRFKLNYSEMVRFNISEECVLVCFLEQIQTMGYEGSFHFVSEAILNVDGDIFDAVDRLYELRK